MISVDRSKEQEPETVPYKITLVTGDVRGAGNSAAALLTLFGEGSFTSLEARHLSLNYPVISVKKVMGLISQQNMFLCRR
jgi:hypothetical protein